MKDLNPKGFDEYPVWKWNDAQDEHEPVKQWNPLPKDEPTLFIKSDFIAADGTKLKGYLIGLDSFYAFGIFVDDEEYVLNLNLPDMMYVSMQAICSSLGRENLELFPLEYRTNVSSDGINSLSGTLEF